uniref:2-(3-amino-3-carboxypropyl)histidine synthase subunit 2 n=1 Tax=Timema genevievae TaxID=629358 RepID=A0A7R9PS86_TIMGE|nr:unnamed protein product [Timema genevievae]
MFGFSSNETVSITKKVEIKEELTITPIESIDQVYELDRCTSWIQDKCVNKVCLQFPDALLGDCVEVAVSLGKRIGRQVYILGDTSCCVDEVAAQHVGADAVIHFGHSCQSPTSRLPVLYVFRKSPLDVSHFVTCFKDTFPDTSEKILLLYDVSYAHYMGEVSDMLEPAFRELCVSRLRVDQQDGGSSWSSLLAEGSQERDYHLLYIGQDGPTLTNLVISLPGRSLRVYDPNSPSPDLRLYDGGKSRFLMRRLYLVERVKDARILGIVVGTLGVSDYLGAVERVKQLAARRGKKCYIFAVGKPNVAKLANFPEVEVFVLIACPENTLVDSKEFFRPLVTLYEVELACQDRPWSERYVVDFRELLPGGLHHAEIEDSPTDPDTPDMSLITGQLRYLGDQLEDSSPDTVALRADMTVSLGAESLASRSWQGLEQKLGQTEVRLAERGRSGLPRGYTDEGEV